MRKFAYIKVYPGKLVARIVGGPNEITIDCPDLTHPRSPIGSFDSLATGMRRVLVETRAISFLVIQPRVLVHLIPPADGGYTQPELRAVRQAALEAGFISPLLCGSEYSPLSDQEILDVRRVLGA